jgi:hypothetical protein
VRTLPASASTFVAKQLRLARAQSIHMVSVEGTDEPELRENLVLPLLHLEDNDDIVELGVVSQSLKKETIFIAEPLLRVESGGLLNGLQAELVSAPMSISHPHVDEGVDEGHDDLLVVKSSELLNDESREVGNKMQAHGENIHSIDRIDPDVRAEKEEKNGSISTVDSEDFAKLVRLLGEAPTEIFFDPFFSMTPVAIRDLATKNKGPRTTLQLLHSLQDEKLMFENPVDLAASLQMLSLPIEQILDEKQMRDNLRSVTATSEYIARSQQIVKELQLQGTLLP